MCTSVGSFEGLELSPGSGPQQQSGSIVGFVGGRMVASLGLYTSKLYDAKLQEWQQVTQEDNETILKRGINVIDSNKRR